MRWLERNGWWFLAALAAVFFIFGLGDLIGGAPDNAVAVTGQTNPQLAAESSKAYLLIQDQVRAGGLQLMLIGLVVGGLVLCAFRNGERWAWWVTWSLPAFSFSAVILHMVDTASGQPLPVPVFSGSISTIIVAVVLLATARRFVGGGAPPAAS